MAKTNEEMFDIRPLERRAQQERILAMESTTVIRFADRRARESRIGRARDARRRLQDVDAERDVTRGRAWINGIEVGEAVGRFAHLSTFHD